MSPQPQITTQTRFALVAAVSCRHVISVYEVQSQVLLVKRAQHLGIHLRRRMVCWSRSSKLRSGSAVFESFDSAGIRGPGCRWPHRDGDGGQHVR